jgi:DNA-binding GntR family transcriptional regulator
MASATPRYVHVYNVLSRRLESGKYPINMRLPTESELCEEFDASRFTVREALRRLVAQGMVQRRQGAGSIVVAATPQARYTHSLSSIEDLFQFALSTHYELHSVKQVALDAETASAIGAVAGERWWLQKGLRSHEKGGEAVCYIHSYIAPRAGAFVPELRKLVGPFYAHLSARTKEDILEVEQDIDGVPMTAEIAGHLKCKPGTISTCALRRYTTKKGTLIASFNWHVAKDFHYRMKMLRNI